MIELVAIAAGCVLAMWLWRERRASKRVARWRREWARIEADFRERHGREMTQRDWDRYWAEHPAQADEHMYDD